MAAPLTVCMWCFEESASKDAKSNDVFKWWFKMLFSLQKTHVTKLVSTLLESRYGDLYMSKQHECSVFAKIDLILQKICNLEKT